MKNHLILSYMDSTLFISSSSCFCAQNLFCILLLLTPGNPLTFVTSACLDSHSNLLLKRWLALKLKRSLLINLLKKTPAYWNMKSRVQGFCFVFNYCIVGIYYGWHIENILKKCLWNERKIKRFTCSRKFIDCLLCVRYSTRCWDI